MANNYLLPEGVENFFKASSTAVATISQSPPLPVPSVLWQPAGLLRYYPGHLSLDRLKVCSLGFLLPIHRDRRYFNYHYGSA